MSVIRTWLRQAVERPLRRLSPRVRVAATGAVKRDVLRLSPEAAQATAVAAGRQARRAVLGDDLVRRLDGVVAPLGRLSVPGAQQAREAFYGDLYRNPGLATRADGLLTRWVGGGDAQSGVRRAFVGLTEARGRALTPDEAVVRDLLATREARWDRLAAKLGGEAPTHFRLYRGVRGEYAIEELVTALETPGRKAVKLSGHTVASWTTDVQQARRFADAPAASVIYGADIPMRQTLADKWVDGSGLLMWCPDQQEVLVAARDLAVPLDRFEVTLGGRVYGPAQRDDLVRAWRALHPKARAA